MKLIVVLAVLVGAFVLACSSPEGPTPNIEATVEARLAEERGKAGEPKQESSESENKITNNPDLLERATEAYRHNDGSEEGMREYYRYLTPASRNDCTEEEFVQGAMSLTSFFIGYGVEYEIKVLGASENGDLGTVTVTWAVENEEPTPEEEEEWKFVDGTWWDSSWESAGCESSASQPDLKTPTKTTIHPALVMSPKDLTVELVKSRIVTPSTMGGGFSSYANPPIFSGREWEKDYSDDTVAIGEERTEYRYKVGTDPLTAILESPILDYYEKGSMDSDEFLRQSIGVLGSMGFSETNARLILGYMEPELDYWIEKGFTDIFFDGIEECIAGMSVRIWLGEGELNIISARLSVTQSGFLMDDFRECEREDTLDISTLTKELAILKTDSMTKPTPTPPIISVPTPTPRPILPVTRIPTPTVQLIPTSTPNPTSVPTKVITDSSCVGKTIRFKIGDVWANENIMWVQGGGDELNLTASTTSLPLKHTTSWPISELAQRVPPHVLVGSVNAADGTSISAWYEGTQLAATTVSGGSYSLIIDNGSCYSSVSDPTPTVVPMPTVTPTPIPTATPVPPASSGGSNYTLVVDQDQESWSGKTATFHVGGNQAEETALWVQGGSTYLDLMAYSGSSHTSPKGYSSSRVSFLSQRTPPHVFAGTAYLDGVPAAKGTTVSAWIDGFLAAETVVYETVSSNVNNSVSSTFQVLIDNDNLETVWKFMNESNDWRFFDPRLGLLGASTLTNVTPGDIVWVKVNSEQSFQSGTLFPGWNLISLD